MQGSILEVILHYLGIWTLKMSTSLDLYLTPWCSDSSGNKIPLQFQLACHLHLWAIVLKVSYIGDFKNLLHNLSPDDWTSYHYHYHKSSTLILNQGWGPSVLNSLRTFYLDIVPVMSHHSLSIQRASALLLKRQEVQFCTHSGLIYLLSNYMDHFIFGVY